MANVRYQEGSLSWSPIKGPVPQVEVKFSVEFSGIDPKRGFALSGWSPEVQLAQVPIATGSISRSFPVPVVGYDRMQGEFSCRLLLFPHLISAVETARKGDVKGTLSPWFHYVDLHERDMQQGGGYWLMSTANAPSIALNFSRDEWAELLDALEYDGSWVVEIPQPGPAAPGWEEVTEHLEAARLELRSGHPRAAAQKCRDAWETASPFLTERWQSVKEIMARGSKAPSKYTSKPERIATVYDDISNLLNDARFAADMAAHGAEHAISDDDALLIYRLTHAVLGYLSRVSGRPRAA